MKLSVEIFDKVGKNKYVSMGAAYYDVGLVLGSPGCYRAKKMKKGGTLVACIRKGTGSGELRLKLKGLQLRNVEGYVHHHLLRRTERICQ
jgi:hypothetical protein